MNRWPIIIRWAVTGILILITLIFLLLPPKQSDLISTFDSSHTQIIELQPKTTLKLSDTQQVVFAIYDPEVQMVQICIRQPEKERPIAASADASFLVDNVYRHANVYMGLDNWLWYHYSAHFLQNVEPFSELTFQLDGQSIDFTMP